MGKRYYEERLPQNLREAFVQASDDQELRDLRQELALLRTILAQYVEENGSNVDEEFIDQVGKLTDKIQKLFGTMSAHEARMREIIPVRLLPVLVQSICGILRDVVGDERVLSTVSERIGRLPILMDVSSKEIDAESE